jgi:hypothetical protein
LALKALQDLVNREDPVKAIVEYTDLYMRAVSSVSYISYWDNDASSRTRRYGIGPVGVLADDFGKDDFRRKAIPRPGILAVVNFCPQLRRFKPAHMIDEKGQFQTSQFYRQRTSFWLIYGDLMRIFELVENARNGLECP